MVNASTRDDDQHIPVLAKPFVAALCHRPDGVVVDATFGRGGHSQMMLQRLSPTGRLIGLDRDPQAVDHGQSLARQDGRFCMVHAEFDCLHAVLEGLALTAVDAIGFDFGVSSPQLDQRQRGFAFSTEGPLEMRMNPQAGASLSTMLRKVRVHDLTKIIRDYGEERYAGRIARAIVAARDDDALHTTTELAAIIVRALPARARYGDPRAASHTHPATRTFQALRIWVNDEYGQIERGLESAIRALAPGGVLAAISFHSGEDRRVRDIVQSHVTPCICPPQFPVCACHRVADMAWLQKKPLRAEVEEVRYNPRSRSAKLRLAVKTSDAA
ncbi:MAG: 16S rRNA (cytosine(1402)-N(4))-methyltransferase RsmH [Mariprofundales bacterium]